MSDPTPSVFSNRAELLAAFQGSITPPRVGALYRTGLVLVAIGMVLLPVVYVGIVALAVWGLYQHLRHDTWMWTNASGRTGTFGLMLYVGLLLIGVVLVFFLIKPFFARRVAVMKPVTLDPAREPVLFEFVRKICQLVGAPEPARIDVDGQVNASARLRGGVFSRELVLTIGLPLAAGLDTRQFAGVLAHEFGHFAQGAGMRLTYLIRQINLWFARVVHERDKWDRELEGGARGTDYRLMLVLQAARGCVWLTRRVLWGLMHVGHAISCFMLRQMEFDADQYEAKVAGSAAFASTVERLQIMNAAVQLAYDDVRHTWASGRLPKNLLHLIEHQAGALLAEVHQKISLADANEKTRWFETHPCNADRIRAVQAQDEPGVFHLSQPATRLFSDFAELGTIVTEHLYTDHFEIAFTEGNLIPASEMLRESQEKSTGDRLIRQTFGEADITLQALWSPTAAEEPSESTADRARALELWQHSREEMQRLRPGAEQFARDWTELQQRRSQLAAAYWLSRAGFKLEPKAFGLSNEAASAGEQELASRKALDQIEAELQSLPVRLEPFANALRRRFRLALTLSGALPTESASQPAALPEWLPLARLQAALVAQTHSLLELGTLRPAFALLAQNFGNHAHPEEVDRELNQLANALAAVVDRVRERLEGCAYPFPDPRGPLNVSDYARPAESPPTKYNRVHLDTETIMHRLYALNHRLVGRLLSVLETAERSLS